MRRADATDPGGVLAGLPAAAHTCDPAGRLTGYNRLAVRLWGREPRLNHPDNLYCGSYRLLTPAGDPLRHDECWMALVLRGDIPSGGGEYIAERPSGDRVPAVAYVNAVRDAAGALVGGLCLALDMSADLRDRAAIRRLAADLDARAAARTATLLEALVAVRAAVAGVRTLRGLVPICAHCKAVRDAAGAWHPVERYVRDRTEAEFSHGICDACVKAHYAELDRTPAPPGPAAGDGEVELR